MKNSRKAWIYATRWVSRLEGRRHGVGRARQAARPKPPGSASGMKLVAVDGRAWTPKLLKESLAAAKADKSSRRSTCCIVNDDLLPDLSAGLPRRRTLSAPRTRRFQAGSAGRHLSGPHATGKSGRDEERPPYNRENLSWTRCSRRMCSRRPEVRRARAGTCVLRASKVTVMMPLAGTPWTSLHAIHFFEDIDRLLHRIRFGQTVHREVRGLDGGFFGGAEIVRVAGVQAHDRKIFR